MSNVKTLVTGEERKTLYDVSFIFSGETLRLTHSSLSIRIVMMIVHSLGI